MKLLLTLTLLTSFGSYAVTEENPYQIHSVELLLETESGLKTLNDFQDKTLKTSVEKSTQKTTLNDLDP